MENFTPLSGLLGGVLIGFGAVMLMALNGRIAGISGILGGLLRPTQDDLCWQVSFLLGLILAPIIFGLVAGGSPNIVIAGGLSTMIAGGLLVGFGTRLGSGCTSGHGVCGISRLSPRSIIATAIFMSCGVITVSLARHVLGSV